MRSRKPASSFAPGPRTPDGNAQSSRTRAAMSGNGVHVTIAPRCSSSIEPRISVLTDSTWTSAQWRRDGVRERGETFFVEAAAAPATVSGKFLPNVPLAANSAAGKAERNARAASQETFRRESPILHAGRLVERLPVAATDVQPKGSYVRHVILRCPFPTLAIRAHVCRDRCSFG